VIGGEPDFPPSALPSARQTKHVVWDFVDFAPKMGKTDAIPCNGRCRGGGMPAGQLTNICIYKI
jgi:hypothetical protein